MLLAKLVLYALILASSFTVSKVMAEADNNDPPNATTGHVSDGSLEPDKIPKTARYAFLISGYELRVRPALADKLSPEDEKVLRELAARNRIDQEPINESYNQARLHLCANRHSMSPVALAQAWTKIIEEWRAKTEARYEQGLNALSKPGRQLVEEFVETSIVPGIKTSARGDAVQTARDDPEIFMEEVEIECYYVENGRFPPHVQEEFDRVIQEMDEEERNRTQ